MSEVVERVDGAAGELRVIKVLHVDDDPVHGIEPIRKKLDGWEHDGFRVEYQSVIGGRDEVKEFYTALAKKQTSFQPDLLIMDLKMPRPGELLLSTQEGLKAIAEIRKITGGAKLGKEKVVIYTSLTKSSDQTRAARGNDYEVLFKSNYRDSIERFKEIIVSIARRKS